MLESKDRCPGYKEIIIIFDGNGHGRQIVKTFACNARIDTPFYCNGFSSSCPKYKSAPVMVKD